MSTDLPLYGVNFKIWRFMGFINAEKKTKLIFLSILPFINAIFQFSYAFKNPRDFAPFVLALASGIMRADCLMRLYTIAMNKKKVDKILKEVEDIINEAQHTKSENTLRIFENVTRRAKIVSTGTLTAGTLVTAGIVFVAFKSARKLPFDIYIPGIDVMESPLFELCFVVQLIFIVPFLTIIHPVYTNIFITWLMFSVGLLKDLSQQILDLPQNDSKKLLQELKRCIRYHKRIMGFIKSFEDLVSVISFLEFTIFGLTLIALMACMAATSAFALRVPIIIWIFAVIYSTIIQYWFANEVAEESMKIANAVYSIDWMCGRSELRSCVIIMIARCQKPITISSAGIIPMNLETYQKLINTSYTFFTLIIRMVEE